jgi:hypothetical protein
MWVRLVNGSHLFPSPSLLSHIHSILYFFSRPPATALFSCSSLSRMAALYARAPAMRSAGGAGSARAPARRGADGRESPELRPGAVPAARDPHGLQPGAVLTAESRPSSGQVRCRRHEILTGSSQAWCRARVPLGPELQPCAVSVARVNATSD